MSIGSSDQRAARAFMRGWKMMKTSFQVRYCLVKVPLNRFKIAVITMLVALMSAMPVHAGEAENQALRRRAVEAAIWGMPAVSMRSAINATKRDLGGDWNDVVYFSKPMVSRHGFLTANNQTPYVISSINTKDGPMVVDVPAASETTKFFGSFIDAWQLPIADVGPTGDDKGKGAKYLFLPPGHKGTIPKGYLIYRPATYSLHLAFRPVSEKGGTLEQAVAYAKRLKVYPLSKAEDPPTTRLLDAYPKKWDTLPKYDISFFNELAAVINEEPVQERDLAMMGLLHSIGIRKGEEFAPDEATADILAGALGEAYNYMQWFFETPGKALAPYWKERRWLGPNLSKEQAAAGFPFMTEDRLLVDERSGGMYFWATFLPRKLGAGSFYLMGLHDVAGKLLNGETLYRLRVPADTPAGDFWSVIAYSMKTKGFIDEAEKVGLSSLDTEVLKANDDGSIDVYFGPTPPEGLRSNWIPTGEDFFLIFRFYGPQKPLYEKTWQLPDVERVN
jgi:hypothetical protein